MIILRSMRGRCLVMMAAFALPLVALVAILALQNDRMVVAQARQNALLAKDAAVQSYSARVAGVEQVLDTLAAVPVARDGTQCRTFLQQVLAAGRGHYTTLRILDGGGAVRCEAGAASQPAWLAKSGDAARFRVGEPRHNQPGNQLVVDAGLELIDAGRLVGEVVASVDGAWLTSDTATGRHHVWMLDQDGQALVGGEAAGGALPAAGTSGRLDGGQVEQSRSRGGDEFLYSVARLDDGARLLIGYDVEADFVAAREGLLQHVAELVVLVIGGFIVIALGAERALVEPLRHLTRSVGRWRGGGTFDPGPSDGVPQEIAELSLSFAHATSALIEREGQLKRAIEQQELLMQEVHHRVKNNLQIVASLLNLQAARIRQPDAKAEFQAARDRIRSLATLHRHLYAHGELQTINMRSFLTELSGQLFQAHAETPGHRIQLEIQAPELQMSSDQAVPLALLVTETLSNSIKYAFPAGRTGRIHVRLDVHDGRATLLIEDDGIGFEPGVGGDAGGRKGLGLKLIRGFAQQLGATLVIEAREGMHYVLEMDVQPVRRASEDAEAAPVAFANDPALPVGGSGRRIG